MYLPNQIPALLTEMPDLVLRKTMKLMHEFHLEGGNTITFLYYTSSSGYLYSCYLIHSWRSLRIFACLTLKSSKHPEKRKLLKSWNEHSTRTNRSSKSTMWLLGSHSMFSRGLLKEGFHFLDSFPLHRGEHMWIDVCRHVQDWKFAFASIFDAQ